MDVSQFEKYADEAKKSAVGANKVISDVTLAWFLQEAEYPETTFEEIDGRIRSLLVTAVKSGDWTNVEMLASGRVEHVNASHVAMRYEEANSTPMSEIAHQKTVETVPLWMSAYVNVHLAHEKYLKHYLAARQDALLDDSDFQSLFERRSQLLGLGAKGAGNEKINRIESLASIKFLHSATRLLEKELRQNMPHVTKSPGFVLLLSSYETLHVLGFRPSFFDKNIQRNATYLNLVQSLLELFPEDSRSDVHKYLAEFKMTEDEGNFRSSLMSRIDYEGDMERMADRGKRRQAAVDGLMARIRTAIGEKAESREE